ncbi:hypothetical protein TCON_1129 [Astathelohania contejeani]|uniref:Uncharacterized protein n=1 Tax=Astathelohania contejeani TaxID=164912 RepID=A0ABQ7HZQ0_9MICR|nr:hypothetical protein TCON_1129 [Thelohania contejeani]
MIMIFFIKYILSSLEDQMKNGSLCISFPDLNIDELNDLQTNKNIYDIENIQEPSEYLNENIIDQMLNSINYNQDQLIEISGSPVQNHWEISDIDLTDMDNFLHNKDSKEIPSTFFSCLNEDCSKINLKNESKGKENSTKCGEKININNKNNNIHKNQIILDNINFNERIDIEMLLKSGEYHMDHFINKLKPGEEIHKTLSYHIELLNLME